MTKPLIQYMPIANIFSESITESKDSKQILAHLRTVKGDSKRSSKNLPDEIVIDNESITNSILLLSPYVILNTCIYKLSHEYQSGFHQKHSCQTALIKFIDNWMECIDNGDMVGALFLDFRKAFDLVDHSTLIKENYPCINLFLQLFSGSTHI